MGLSLRQKLELRLMIWRLPRRVRRLALPRLLAAMLPAAGQRPWQAAPAAVVGAVRQALAHPVRMRGRRCLREGLAAFHFLRRAGHPAVLHFGIDRESTRASRLRGHCWVSLEGTIVLNAPDPCFVELFAYAGQPLPQAGTAPLAAMGL